jgi:hypothetical protein
MDGLVPRVFAAATFDDHDAGSGPVQSSPNLGPMTAAMHNISARHLHDIATTLPDDRQFLRSWRRQLQDCLSQQHSRLVRFLIADGGGSSGGGAVTAVTDVDSTEFIRKANDILTKYAKPTWNFASSTRDLALSTDTTTAAAAIEAELGMSPAALRDIQKRAIRLYAAAATAVAAAEGRLEEKLKRLETIHGRVSDLMFLEPTPALETMTAATRGYLDSVYEKVDLEPDYRDLIEQYKRFSVLRSAVGLGQFQRPAAPTCSICMTREVTQALTPCGHTYCDECTRSQLTGCYICRVQIRDKIRLFFN